MDAQQKKAFMFNAKSILLLLAVVTFVLAAFGVTFGTVLLVPLGLAFFAAAFLVT